MEWVVIVIIASVILLPLLFAIFYSRRAKGRADLDSPDKSKEPDSAQPPMVAERVYPATVKVAVKEPAPKPLVSIGEARLGEAWQRAEPRKDANGLFRIQMLSTLKRAVIWAEILKPPRGLEPPE